MPTAHAAYICRVVKAQTTEGSTAARIIVARIRERLIETHGEGVAAHHQLTPSSRFRGCRRAAGSLALPFFLQCLPASRCTAPVRDGRGVEPCVAIRFPRPRSVPMGHRLLHHLQFVVLRFDTRPAALRSAADYPGGERHCRDFASGICQPRYFQRTRPAAADYAGSGGLVARGRLTLFYAALASIGILLSIRLKFCTRLPVAQYAKAGLFRPLTSRCGLAHTLANNAVASEELAAQRRLTSRTWLSQ